jgi:hypothetical protein
MLSRIYDHRYINLQINPLSGEEDDVDVFSKLF